MDSGRNIIEIIEKGIICLNIFHRRKTVVLFFRGQNHSREYFIKVFSAVQILGGKGKQMNEPRKKREKKTKEKRTTSILKGGGIFFSASFLQLSPINQGSRLISAAVFILWFGSFARSFIISRKQAENRKEKE